MTYIIYFIEGIKYFLGKKILFTAFLSGKLYFFAFFRLFRFQVQSGTHKPLKFMQTCYDIISISLLLKKIRLYDENSLDNSLTKYFIWIKIRLLKM